MRPAHRVAWELLNGPVPDELNVLHRCDVRRCVRHLFLGSQSDNMQDASIKGRMFTPRKLTVERVVEARARHAAGENYAALARDYGVSRHVLRAAVLGLTWKRVG